MLRRLGRIFVAVTLLLMMTLLLASCVAWVRSLNTFDFVRRESLTGEFCASSFKGTLTLEWNTTKSAQIEWSSHTTTLPESSHEPSTESEWLIDMVYQTQIAFAAMSHAPGLNTASGIETHWRIGWDGCGIHRFAYAGTFPVKYGLGIGGWNTVYPRNAFATTAQIPYWLIASLSAICPLVWLYFFIRRSRRKKLNLCVACGYDLRSSPAACPECGRVRPNMSKKGVRSLF